MKWSHQIWIYQDDEYDDGMGENGNLESKKDLLVERPFEFIRSTTQYFMGLKYIEIFWYQSLYRWMSLFNVLSCTYYILCQHYPQRDEFKTIFFLSIHTFSWNKILTDVQELAEFKLCCLKCIHMYTKENGVVV